MSTSPLAKKQKLDTFDIKKMNKDCINNINANNSNVITIYLPYD